MKKRTIPDINLELKEKDIPIFFYEDQIYKDNKQSLKAKCLICKKDFYIRANTALGGHIHRECAIKKSSQNASKTNDTFKKQMEVINPSIKVLTEYKNLHTKVLCECKEGHNWEALPGNLLAGHGCPKCKIIMLSNLNQKTHEHFVLEVSEFNPNITILGKYTNSDDYIEWHCNECGGDFTSRAQNLLIYGCSKCANQRVHNLQRKTLKVFKQEMLDINSDIEIIGEYINSKEPIECKCKICNTTWFATPNNLLNDSGCPGCVMSKGELKVQRFLKKYNINYISQYKENDCKDKKTLPFDFYLQDYNTMIEYDGEQHYRVVAFGNTTEAEAEKEFRRNKKHDSIKTKYCEDHNIKLIRIPYWDYKNIETILIKELLLEPKEEKTSMLNLIDESLIEW